MRRAVVIIAAGVALTTAAAAWFWSHAQPVASSPALQPIAQRVDPLAQPLTAPRGAGRLSGRVLRGGLPVAHAIVTATVPDGSPLALRCGCEDGCGLTAFEC